MRPLSKQINRSLRGSCIIIFLTLCFNPVLDAQQHRQELGGSYFRRITRLSNFEFAIHNDGVLYGNYYYNEDWREVGLKVYEWAPWLQQWPRGSTYDMSSSETGGFLFLAKKNGRYLSSTPQVGWYIRTWSSGPFFREMVPGRIGDPKAAYDTVYGGAGWRYVDDPDYIVYSSIDYDSNGVDISGNNYNDWPIRLINNKPEYVPEPLLRWKYPPVYRSVEDLFTIFKDTDTRADIHYTGPGGWSEPIGIEVRNTIFTWGSGLEKDIVIFEYDIWNRGGADLDSCYIMFVGPNFARLHHKMNTYSDSVYGVVPYDEFDRYDAKNLSHLKNPPTIGYPILQTPMGYSEKSASLYRVAPYDYIYYYVRPSDTYRFGYSVVPDSQIYVAITQEQLPPWKSFPPETIDPFHFNSHSMVIGPFPLTNGEHGMFRIGILFSDSLESLKLMTNYMNKLVTSNYQRPSPPRPSTMRVTPLDRHMKITWDTLAESSTDPIIPDSLGKPFKGYRLLRALKKEGPYKELGRWTTDSGLVHEYIDYGTDIGGLKNNVQYYYRLLSFDEGAKLLKLDPMESPPIDCVNAVAVIPETPASSVMDLNDVKIVPNPYIARHEAQRGEKKLFFNYLPEVCTIRIYTVALDLVKTIHHNGGTREEWDLRTDGGQYVASQMLYAYINAPGGKSVVKKFGVVVGK